MVVVVFLPPARFPTSDLNVALNDPRLWKPTPDATSLTDSSVLRSFSLARSIRRVTR